jgi:hypothetical protein
LNREDELEASTASSHSDIIIKEIYTIKYLNNRTLCVYDSRLALLLLSFRTRPVRNRIGNLKKKKPIKTVGDWNLSFSFLFYRAAVRNFFKVMARLDVVD